MKEKSRDEIDALFFDIHEIKTHLGAQAYRAADRVESMIFEIWKDCEGESEGIAGLPDDETMAREAGAFTRKYRDWLVSKEAANILELEAEYSY